MRFSSSDQNDVVDIIITIFKGCLSHFRTNIKSDEGTTVIIPKYMSTYI